MSSLGGVPVLNLPIFNPNDFSELVKSSADNSPILPPFTRLSPIYKSPLKNVPVASTTAFAKNSIPVLVFIPFTTFSILLEPFSTISISSTINSVTISCIVSRFS